MISILPEPITIINIGTYKPNEDDEPLTNNDIKTSNSNIETPPPSFTSPGTAPSPPSIPLFKAKPKQLFSMIFKARVNGPIYMKDEEEMDMIIPDDIYGEECLLKKNDEYYDNESDDDVNDIPKIFRKKKYNKKEKIASHKSQRWIRSLIKKKNEKTEVIIEDQIRNKKDNIARKYRHLIKPRRVTSPNFVNDYQDNYVPPQFERDVLNNVNTASVTMGVTQAQLMDLLNRELTPEDYELLLLLDESVAPKTVDNKKIESFDSFEVKSMDDLKELVCVICMDDYKIGDKLKKLPCGHTFHNDCITSWLNNSSQNCPLDGMNVNTN